MPTAATKPARLTIPTEVRAFAEKRGLVPYLPGIVEVLHRTFADAMRMTVDVQEDPEEAGLRTLIFEVEVPWSQEQWRTGMKAWRRETAAVCPASLLTEFSLITYRRPA
jgi:hypothetical protein